MKNYFKYTMGTINNLVCASLVGATAYLAYKKSTSIAWYLTSGYSYVKFYTTRRKDNSVKVISVKDAITHKPFPIVLEDGYEEHVEVKYIWNEKKYTVIYEPFKKILFPPYDEGKMLSAFVSEYEFYIRSEKGVVKVNDFLLEKIAEVIGPLCDFYEHCQGVVSPRKALLHYHIINTNQMLLMYDVFTGEEKEF